jgi:hypothetical protein
VRNLRAVGLSLGQLPHPRVTPSYLAARNTNRQPHRSGGIACDYVAEEMHAKVNSAKVDGEDQACAQGHNNPAEAHPASDDEEVSHHRVDHQHTSSTCRSGVYRTHMAVGEIGVAEDERFDSTSPRVKALAGNCLVF